MVRSGHVLEEVDQRVEDAERHEVVRPVPGDGHDDRLATVEPGGRAQGEGGVGVEDGCLLGAELVAPYRAVTTAVTVCRSPLPRAKALIGRATR